ncbi:hypothetical protein GCM10010359_28400 [Streptomyces morookaense]|nr:hypothetical protein GCM10010359_28400 [Streptomyces morookaense]
MSDRSAIEWTEATWNPTTGCDRVSAGCDNCYALTLAKRLEATGAAKYQGDGDPRTSGPGHPRSAEKERGFGMRHVPIPPPRHLPLPPARGIRPARATGLRNNAQLRSGRIRLRGDRTR